MRWTSVAAVLVAAGVTLAADEKPAKELEPFQGTWAVESSSAQLQSEV